MDVILKIPFDITLCHELMNVIADMTSGNAKTNACRYKVSVSKISGTKFVEFIPENLPEEQVRLMSAPAKGTA